MEVRIGPNDEMLVRGPNVMKGYLNKPKETAEVIDADGWFHTGDQGKFDDGRQPHHHRPHQGAHRHRLRQEHRAGRRSNRPSRQSKYVEQVMVYGDRKPFLTALVVPSPLALEGFLPREEASPASATPTCSTTRRSLKLFDEEIKKALAGFAQYEQVHRFRLIPEPFSVENGLLTPSLKMRRPQVSRTPTTT